MTAPLGQLLAVPLAIVAILTFVQPVQGQWVTDCSEFATYDEAQVYYATYPEAAPIVDPNYDGRACEIWFGVDGYASADGGDGSYVPAEGGDGGYSDAGGGDSVIYTGSGGLDGIDYDCGQFASQAEAQAYFEADGGSVYNNVDGLDSDLDGIVCENF